MRVALTFAGGVAAVLAICVREAKPHSTAAMVCIVIMTVVTLGFAHIADVGARSAEADDPPP
jgi:hypothetical protein